MTADTTPSLLGKTINNLSSALADMTARAEAAEANARRLEEVLRPFERALKTLDVRFDDETKIMIELPTTKRVRPTTYVYVEDAKRMRTALEQTKGDRSEPV